MIFIDLKFGQIFKDVTKGNMLQLVYKIDDESDETLKYNIKDEDNNLLYESKNDLVSPFEETKYFAINPTKVFKKSFMTVTFNVTNKKGETKQKSFNINTFNLILDERFDINNFTYYIFNLDVYPINTQIEILDINDTVVLTGKTFFNGFCNEKIQLQDIISMKNLPYGHYFYRIKYYSKEENWTNYFPNKKGLKLNYIEDERPSIFIKDSKLDLNFDNNFELKMNVIFRDPDLDDIKYRIIDDYNNVVCYREEYKFVPKTENFSFIYDYDYFNHLYLNLFLQNKDIITYRTLSTCKLPLFSIKNLHRFQDHLIWEYRNFSNKIVSMQIEVLDFWDNIVLKGNEIKKSNSNNYQTIKEEKELDLDVDYYKFRLHIWNEKENLNEYYELDYGTQFTILQHTAPKISNYNVELSRDLDDKKRIHIQAYISDREMDKFEFSIKDETGFQIFKSKDPIDPPYQINLTLPYNFIEKLQSKIILTVKDSHNAESSVTKTVLAFKIKDLSQSNGFIFKWLLDNLSDQKLKMEIEILDLSKKLIKTTLPLFEDYTEFYTEEKIRLIPKIKTGKYYYRLKCTDVETNDYWYFDDGLNLPFEAHGNNPPEIYIENSEDYLIDEKTLHVKIKGTFSDPDYDKIAFSIKDFKNEYLLKQEDFIDSPYSFFVEKDYKLEELIDSRIPFTLECKDEEELTETKVFYIDLFSIGNIYRIYNKFYWDYRVFGKKPIKTLLEIVDEEGYLQGVGKVKEKNNTFDFKEIVQEMQFEHFDEGNYFFRVKVWSEGEYWIKYLPNTVGIPFYLKYNNPPKIDINSIAYDANNKENIDIKGKITDKDNDSVYYNIKDNE